MEHKYFALTSFCRNINTLSCCYGKTLVARDSHRHNHILIQHTRDQYDLWAKSVLLGNDNFGISRFLYF